MKDPFKMGALEADLEAAQKAYEARKAAKGTESSPKFPQPGAGFGGGSSGGALVATLHYKPVEARGVAAASDDELDVESVRTETPQAAVQLATTTPVGQHPLMAAVVTANMLAAGGGPTHQRLAVRQTTGTHARHHSGDAAREAISGGDAYHDANGDGQFDAGVMPSFNTSAASTTDAPPPAPETPRAVRRLEEARRLESRLSLPDGASGASLGRPLPRSPPTCSRRGVEVHLTAALSEPPTDHDDGPRRAGALTRSRAVGEANGHELPPPPHAGHDATRDVGVVGAARHRAGVARASADARRAAAEEAARRRDAALEAVRLATEAASAAEAAAEAAEAAASGAELALTMLLGEEEDAL